MDKLSMSESGVKKVIKKLKDEGTLHRIGSLKSGYWEIKTSIKEKFGTQNAL